MNIEVTTSEEFKGIVTMFLSNNTTVSVPTESLVEYVEKEGMNVTSTYGGNSGSGEPWNDNEEVDEVQDVNEYIDQNWDYVCEVYFANVLNK